MCTDSGVDRADATQPDGAGRRVLFCLPYAGGGVAVFRGWEERLPDVVEVCALELPGRAPRIGVPPARRMEALVDALMEQIEPLLAMQFALFGHSMGALVAFELARAIRARGFVEPVALFVSAHRAPHLEGERAALSRLSDVDLRAELRRLGGTPPELLQSPAFMELLLPTIRADFEVCETYVYVERPPLECPIVAFGGSEDAQVGEDELQGWSEMTTGCFRLVMLRGGHFFINENREALLGEMDGYCAPLRAYR
jgi:medium-chain acyl-[acyl-carrier-protein] hydrolase